MAGKASASFANKLILHARKSMPRIIFLNFDVILFMLVFKFL
jgi:hypothetical protein